MFVNKHFNILSMNKFLHSIYFCTYYCVDFFVNPFCKNKCFLMYSIWKLKSLLKKPLKPISVHNLMWYKNEYFVTFRKYVVQYTWQRLLSIFTVKTQTADNLPIRCEMSCQQDGDGGYYSAANIKLLSDDVTAQLWHCYL